MKKIHSIWCIFSIFFVFSLLICLFVPSTYASDQTTLNPDILFEAGQNLLSSSNPQDMVKGIALIISAANEGSAKAMVQMGMMYSSGLGKLLSEDFVEGTEPEQALSWYIKAAEAGEKELAASAIATDAFSYFLGKEDGSIKEDDAVALTYFQQAAEYGDPSAINMMVTFYLYGFGVEQDPDKALELCSSLADKGDEDALFAMEDYAYAYYAGTKDGLDINFGTSFKFYEKLTEYGNVRAMYNIGLLYEYGLGTPRDHDKAVEWLTKASAAGYEPAKSMLDAFSD